MALAQHLAIFYAGRAAFTPRAYVVGFDFLLNI